MGSYAFVPTPYINKLIINETQYNGPVNLIPKSASFKDTLKNLLRDFKLNLNSGNVAKVHTSCVHNGEIHIFGTETSVLDHYKFSFDLNMWVKLNDLPGDPTQITRYKAVSIPQTGKIHIFDLLSSGGALSEYSWNESDDSWDFEDYMPYSNGSFLIYRRDLAAGNNSGTNATVIHHYHQEDSTSGDWWRYTKYYEEGEDPGNWIRSSQVTGIELSNTSGSMVTIDKESSYELHYIGVNGGVGHVGYPNGPTGSKVVYNNIGLTAIVGVVNQAFSMNNNIYAVMNREAIYSWDKTNDTWTKVLDLPIQPARVEHIGDTLYLIGGDDSSKKFYESDMLYAIEYGE